MVQVSITWVDKNNLIVDSSLGKINKPQKKMKRTFLTEWA